MNSNKKNNKKVFLGGFPVDQTAQDFYTYMRQYGPIDHWRLVIHDGKSKGYGFVTYRHPRDAEKARNTLHCLKGKHMECNFVFVGQSAKEYREEIMTRKVFVSRLPLELTEAELQGAFIPFGEVERTSIVREHLTDLSRGCGFVIFHNASSAQKAIQQTIVLIGQHKIRVSECKPDQTINKMDSITDKAMINENGYYDSLAQQEEEHKILPHQICCYKELVSRQSIESILTHFSFQDENYRVNIRAAYRRAGKSENNSSQTTLPQIIPTRIPTARALSPESPTLSFIIS